MNTEDQYMNITARVRCGSSGDPVCEPIDVAHVTSCHMAGVCAEVRKARRETMSNIMDSLTAQIVLNKEGANKECGTLTNVGLQEAYQIVNDMAIAENIGGSIRALDDREEGES